MATCFGKDGLERATGLTGKELFDHLDDERVYAGFNKYCQNLAWMLNNLQFFVRCGYNFDWWRYIGTA